MKIRPVGAEVFREERQADRQTWQLTDPFRNFAKAPKTEHFIYKL